MVNKKEVNKELMKSRRKTSQIPGFFIELKRLHVFRDFKKGS